MFKSILFSLIFYLAFLTVTNVEHGIVTLESTMGIEYQIEEAEAWRVGDPATAVISTMLTKDPSDDVIVEIVYTGWRHLHD